MEKDFFSQHFIISGIKHQSGDKQKQSDFESKFREKMIKKMGSRKNTRED